MSHLRTALQTCHSVASIAVLTRASLHVSFSIHLSWRIHETTCLMRCMFPPHSVYVTHRLIRCMFPPHSVYVTHEASFGLCYIHGLIRCRHVVSASFGVCHMPHEVYVSPWLIPCMFLHGSFGIHRMSYGET